MCSIAITFHSLHYHFRWNCFQVIGPAKFCHAINEGCSVIKAMVQFIGLIVLWKYVMEIMPAFAKCENGYNVIIRRTNESEKYDRWCKRAFLSTKIKTDLPFTCHMDDFRTYEQSCSQKMQYLKRLSNAKQQQWKRHFPHFLATNRPEAMLAERSKQLVSISCNT